VNAAASRHRAKLVLCFAIVYLVWGSTYLATKIGVHELPPFLFGAVRFIGSGLALWLFARALGRGPARVPPGEWKHLVVVGFCTVLVSNGCNVWGVQWVPSNQAALLNVSASFWIVILGMYGRRAHAVSRRVGIGLAIGLAGTLLVLWPDARAHVATQAAGALGASIGTSASAARGASSSPLFASLVILLGCVGWAAGTIYMRNVRTSLDVLSFTGLQMLCGGLMMLVPALLGGEVALWRWTAPGMAALAYMMVFSSLLAYTAYAWLSVNTTPAQVGTYGFVNPAIATLLGWFALGETLSPARAVGMVVILAGVVLVNWPARAAVAQSAG
jgi:drug/metabolite transporter (DMT)-like permease